MSESSTDSISTGTGWWRNAAIYQVYVRSFADGNGDGTGDIAGLRSRLEYLAELGVDAIWINPWYASPLKDGGYDVADYRQIDERFGTMEEAEQMIAEAHELGIRVIVDLVPNHTSDQHVWFQEALAAEPGDPARDRYMFRPGKGPNGDEPPSDWLAVFGGPAWKRVADGEWYLHLFDESQPDLNWENEEVQEEFKDIFRFWLDRGVDGFRVDVAHGMVKDPELTDTGGKKHQLLEMDEPEDHPFFDRDGVHDLIRDWRKVVDEYEDRMMVAEAWVHLKRIPLYLRPDEYHQSFNFDLLEADWEAKVFRQLIERSIEATSSVGAASTWVLSNHDVMRHTTRHGLPPGTKWRTWPVSGDPDKLDQERGNRRARAAALITLSLPGSVYIYQGEELGLPEVWDLPPEVLDDPVWERSGHEAKGRDGCRVPIPWEPDGPSFGFGSSEPWLPQPEVFGELAASVQADNPSSTLTLYRTALRLRKSLFGDDESFEMVDLGPKVLAYRRASDVLVVANMGDEPARLPKGHVVLSSSVEPLDQSTGLLPSDTTVWLSSAD